MLSSFYVQIFEIRFLLFFDATLLADGLGFSDTKALVLLFCGDLLFLFVELRHRLQIHAR